MRGVEIGDIVALNSGSPDMVVGKINFVGPEERGTGYVRTLATTYWYNGYTIDTAKFDIRCLFNKTRSEDN